MDADSIGSRGFIPGQADSMGSMGYIYSTGGVQQEVENLSQIKFLTISDRLSFLTSPEQVKFLTDSERLSFLE